MANAGRLRFRSESSPFRFPMATSSRRSHHPLQHLISAPFNRPEVLAKLRPAFAAAGSIVLARACDPASFRRPRMRSFDLANRGRYELAELPAQPALRQFAEALTGRRVVPAWVRLQRFRRGGYSLFYDDAVTRLETGLELTLDLSRSIAGVPAVYSSGLIVPQAPGIVAAVVRTPEIFRYDRYLPASVGRAQVLRLRAAFTFAD